MATAATDTKNMTYLDATIMGAHTMEAWVWRRIIAATARWTSIFSSVDEFLRSGSVARVRVQHGLVF